MEGDLLLNGLAVIIFTFKPTNNLHTDYKVVEHMANNITPRVRKRDTKTFGFN